MTTTRIDHTGHNHPSTTAARTACRKAMKATTEAAPVFHLVAVGNGKFRHAALMGVDGSVLGARCGTGVNGVLSGGVRRPAKIKTWTSEINDVNCNRCRG